MVGAYARFSFAFLMLLTNLFCLFVFSCLFVCLFVCVLNPIHAQFQCVLHFFGLKSSCLYIPSAT